MRDLTEHRQDMMASWLTLGRGVRVRDSPPERSTHTTRYPRVEKVENLVVEGEGQVLHLIERIVAPLGLRVDESMHELEARLPHGPRVNCDSRDN